MGGTMLYFNSHPGPAIKPQALKQEPKKVTN